MGTDRENTSAGGEISIENAGIGGKIPRAHWPLEIFERPPNHAVGQHNKAGKKPRMTLCGHPWLFVRFLLCVYRAHCRDPPFPSFLKFSKMTKRRQKNVL